MGGEGREGRKLERREGAYFQGTAIRRGGKGK